MIKHIYKVFSLVALTTLLMACRTERTTEQAEIVVTIAPLKYIVEQITASDFHIEVLVPTGTSPETFDPTPRQIMMLDKAEMVFTTGLIDFEKALLARVGKKNITNLSHGIELIEGACSHTHNNHAHTHHHGVDPHIWTSPRELKIMAENAHNAIMQHYADSTKYTQAYDKLIKELDKLDSECHDDIVLSNTRAFSIYHPALTYYARAYGLEQIAIEDDGKEPSAKHIAHIIDKSREKNIKCLLYQSEFPRSTVDIVAKDIGVTPREINPLDGNPVQFIRDVTLYITGK